MTLEPVRCSSCGRAISEESPSGDPASRMPCPDCGSLARAFSFVGSGGVTLGGAAVTSFGTIGTWPSILVQAVVELGDKTSEGHPIQAVGPLWFEIAKMIQRDPSEIYRIPPRKWEEMIAGWYKAHGFEVTLTPQSGDLGRDVIAVKRGVLSVRIIDQVKAYAPGHLVPANDVRALLHVLGNDRAASKGLVTTTSDFAPKIKTDPTIAPYLPTRLELVNGTELVRRLGKTRNDQVAMRDQSPADARAIIRPPLA